jgi:hypothetical protein
MTHTAYHPVLRMIYAVVVYTVPGCQKTRFLDIVPYCHEYSEVSSPKYNEICTIINKLYYK